MRARATGGAIVAVLVAALVASGCRIQPVRDPRVIENPSVVTIVGWNGTHGGGGTGFFVAPGQVVTCRHVAEAMEDVFVRMADRRQVPVRAVLAESKEHDLILLAVDPYLGVPPVALAEASPKAGDDLTAIGSPELRAQTVADVRFTGRETVERGFGPVLRVRGELAPGASGAPLFDAGGRVVGVFSGLDADSDDFYVVPARFVKALVPGAPRPMQEWGAETGADPTYRTRMDFNDAGQSFWRKDYEKALRQADAVLPAVLAMPGYGRAACDLIARCCVAMGRPDDGVARLRAIVAGHPNETWSHTALATLLMGLDRPAEAEPEARAVLALEPDSAWALQAVGAALADQGKHAEALPFLEAAARKAPTSAKYRSDVAKVYAALGRADDAIAADEEAVRLDPAFVQAHGGLAVLYRWKGDVERSQRELETVRRLDPSAVAEVEKSIAALPAAR